MLVLVILVCGGITQVFTQVVPVSVVGAMHEVMWKGKLEATVMVDTLPDHLGMTGIGPLAYLQGEILLLNDTCYVSRVLNDSVMRVTTEVHAGAPFFVFAPIQKWKQISIPDGNYTMIKFEHALDSILKEVDDAIAFSITGTFKEAEVHIVNLPEGAVVRSPNDAHQGQVQYRQQTVSGIAVGFFSRKHKTIFTHHDTFMHIHFIRDDRQWMGHADGLIFSSKDVQVYIAIQ